MLTSPLALKVSDKIQYTAMIEIEIEIYETGSGKRPFKDWIDDLREGLTQAKVWTRIDRLKMGNFGDCKTLQDGVCELRIDYGPGLRIYYGKIGAKLILLGVVRK